MSKRDKIIVWVTMVLVIIPGAISFFLKVGSYFMVEVEEGMSGFVLPFFNYLFVAMGFVALFLWAYLKGDFKDIEKPALEMMEMERRYEENNARV